MKQIKIKDLSKTLDICHKHQIPVLLLSSPGVGKTTSVRRWSDGKFEYSFFGSIVGADSADLTGINIPDIEKRMAVNLPFETLEQFATHPGLIFLDELTKASDLVKRSLYNLISQRTLPSGKLLHENSYIILAGNIGRKNGDRIDPAFYNRCATFYINPPTPTEWVEYILSTGAKVAPVIAKTLLTNPQLMAEDERFAPFASPRSWEMLNRLEDEKTILSLAPAIVGETAASLLEINQEPLPVPDYLEVEKFVGLDPNKKLQLIGEWVGYPFTNEEKEKLIILLTSPNFDPDLFGVSISLLKSMHPDIIRDKRIQQKFYKTSQI